MSYKTTCYFQMQSLFGWRNSVSLCETGKDALLKNVLYKQNESLVTIDNVGVKIWKLLHGEQVDCVGALSPCRDHTHVMSSYDGNTQKSIELLLNWW